MAWTPRPKHHQAKLLGEQIHWSSRPAHKQHNKELKRQWSQLMSIHPRRSSKSHLFDPPKWSITNQPCSKLIPKVFTVTSVVPTLTLTQRVLMALPVTLLKVPWNRYWMSFNLQHIYMHIHIQMALRCGQQAGISKSPQAQLWPKKKKATLTKKRAAEARLLLLAHLPSRQRSCWIPEEGILYRITKQIEPQILMMHIGWAHWRKARMKIKYNINIQNHRGERPRARCRRAIWKCTATWRANTSETEASRRGRPLK